MSCTEALVILDGLKTEISAYLKESWSNRLCELNYALDVAVDALTYIIQTEAEKEEMGEVKC